MAFRPSPAGRPAQIHDYLLNEPILGTSVSQTGSAKLGYTHATTAFRSES